MPKIYRSIKTNILTQGFGLAETKPSMLAFYKSIGLLAHNGYDFAIRCQDNALKKGGQCENVYFDCSGKGTIYRIQTDEKLGLGIDIITEDIDGIFQHRYWHFDQINPILKVGQIIESGDLLGVAGNTGYSSGAHLHRDLKPMGKDPYGGYYKRDSLNGYEGAINLKPYFINQFILDVKQGLEIQVSLFQKAIDAMKKAITLLLKK